MGTTTLIHIGKTLKECAYARLPGGCGKTKHCTACTLRNTIEATARTGQSYSDVSVVQTTLNDSGSSRVRYRIATEKVKDVIFLRVERTG